MPNQITEREYAQMEYLSSFPTSAPIDHLLKLPRYSDTSFPMFEEGLDLASMYYGIMMVCGKEGNGKTMFGAALAGRLKHIFPHRHVISDQHLKPEFGPYTYWDWDDEDFIKELEAVSRMAKEGKGWNQESKLHNAIVLLDELYNKLHNRRGGSAKSILMGDIVKQWRHYHFLMIGMAPAEDEIDKKGWVNRVTHEVRCERSEDRLGYSDIVIFNKRMHKVTHAIQLEHSYWGQLFWTDAPITMRQPIKRKV